MGRIDLLSCNLAEKGGKHNPLVLELEELTGYNVCASTDLTGNRAEGGNWVLETDGVDAAREYFVAVRLRNWHGKLDEIGVELLMCFCYPCFVCAAYAIRKACWCGCYTCGRLCCLLDKSP